MILPLLRARLLRRYSVVAWRGAAGPDWFPASALSQARGVQSRLFGYTPDVLNLALQMQKNASEPGSRGTRKSAVAGEPGWGGAGWAVSMRADR